MSGHTIVLLQYTKQNRSRTFLDYKSVPQASEGITSLFEGHLKEQNPHLPNISYDIRDLHSFIDQLYIISKAQRKHSDRFLHVQADISALVFDAQLKAYVPYAKSWIKEQLGIHIRKQFQPRRR